MNARRGWDILYGVVARKWCRCKPEDKYQKRFVKKIREEVTGLQHPLTSPLLGRRGVKLLSSFEKLHLLLKKITSKIYTI